MQTQILIHEDSCQGYTSNRFPLSYNGLLYPYTEDTGFTFNVNYEDRKMTASVVCDGHSGYMTSYIICEFIQTVFPKIINTSQGNITNALAQLFVDVEDHVNKMKSKIGSSGSTCNVTVFDLTMKQVFVASLGDSPTMCYRKDDSGKFYLAWKSKDQDCADKEEVDRMVQIHKKNGDSIASVSNVVYEVTIKGVGTGVWRNTRTDGMLHSSIGDIYLEYYPGIVNKIPRIYS